MNNKVVVALDLGTTGNRAIAFSKDGSVAAKAYYEFPQIFPKPGWVEHNPMDILDSTFKALKEVVSIVGAANIDSIGIANQRETAVVWNKKTGKPIYNAIVWQCRRTEDICKSLNSCGSFIKEKTGLFLDPYFSATKIKWIIDNVPAVKQMAASGELLFGTVDTWVLWNLTGGKTHATEPSNASRTLVFDIKELEFSKELLNIFGIPENILPEVKDSDSLFGYTDKNITGTAIPVHGILGDQQASLFAHCGWEEGVIKSTYGTGIFVLTAIKDKAPKTDTLITTVAWTRGGKTAYALEGSAFMGGASIQWLRDNLKIIKSAPETEQIAASLENNEGVYFVPAFQGLGAPYWDANARGLITGLSRKSNSANIVRAAVESLAYQVKDIMLEMKKASNIEFKVLRADGGASANNFLMQFQSDILSMTVECPALSDTTALGAAAVSGIATGFWSVDEFKNIRGGAKVYEPSKNIKDTELFYEGWKKAVERSRNWA
jgi:glycerol kinase